MEDILLGSVDRSIFVFIPDSASTDGSGKTGLVAANLTVSYARMETDNDATVTDVTSSLSDLAALTTAHTDWGLKEVSSTLAPGLYRLDPADAVFASGAWTAVVYVMVTTSAAAAVPKAFNLVAYNALDAVRQGLTALPNAAADAAGGLPISDAGGLDLDAQIVTKINDILTDTGTTLQAEVDGIQADTEDIQSRLPAALTADGNIKADTLRISGTLQTANDVGADVNDILTDTAEIGAAGAGLTNINLPNQTMDIVGSITGSLSGSVGSVTGAVGSVTGAVGSVTGNVGGNVTGTVGGFTASAKAEIQAEAEDALVTHRLDELVNADSDIDGAAPPAVGSVFHELMTKTAGSFTYDQTTDALEALRDRGDAAWVTASGFSTLSQADVRTAVGLASANLDTQLADIETKVDDVETNLGTPSNFGSGATVSANLVDIEGQTDDIGAAGAGLTALATQASVNTIDDFLDTEIAAIKAKTDSLTFTGAGRVDANVLAVNSSTTGVDKLSAHLPSVLKVVIGSGSTTTSIVLNASTGIDGGAPSSTNDFFNGAVIIFTSGALAGQRTDITDYVGSTVTLTVTALTGAPSAADTAVIV
jgi:hypothetical protein